MARADLLKQLFRAYRNSDRERFMDAARIIVDEERKKHHPLLANELNRILQNGVAVASPSLSGPFQPPPRDQDRRTPLLEVRHPDRFFGELVMREPQRNLLSRVIQEFRAWDILEANGLTPSHKVLFCGPPGCGKTVTAEAISSETGLPLLYARFDSIVSSLLGETAANLRKVFDYASQDNWVILFDEFDAIGRSRDDATEHGEIKRVVNSFLQMLDNFKSRSIVIAATNFEQSLDPALWRRFDEVLRFDMPQKDEITSLMKLRLKPLRQRSIHLRDLAPQLVGSSFSDVERICLDVLKACALDGRTSMTEEDLTNSMKRHEERMTVLKSSHAGTTPRVSAPREPSVG